MNRYKQSLLAFNIAFVLLSIILFLMYKDSKLSILFFIFNMWASSIFLMLANIKDILISQSKWEKKKSKKKSLKD